MTPLAWDPRASMLRRLGLAAAVSEILAALTAGVFYLGGIPDLSLSQAFNVGWTVFFLIFVPACLLYVRRSDLALNGDRIVRIAEARLDGRRANLLRARSRRR